MRLNPLVYRSSVWPCRSAEREHSFRGLGEALKLGQDPIFIFTAVAIVATAATIVTVATIVTLATVAAVATVVTVAIIII